MTSYISTEVVSARGFLNAFCACVAIFQIILVSLIVTLYDLQNFIFFFYLSVYMNSVDRKEEGIRLHTRRTFHMVQFFFFFFFFLIFFL